MPEIDLGVDFATAEAEVELSRKPAPAGDYELIVSANPEKQTTKETSKKPNRPMLSWQLKIVNNSDSSLNGKMVFYNTPLPWQFEGKFDTSGINFLVDLTKSLGKEWSGGRIATEDYISTTCRAKLKVTEHNGKQRNEVEKFY